MSIFLILWCVTSILVGISDIYRISMDEKELTIPLEEKDKIIGLHNVFFFPSFVVIKIYMTMKK